MPGSGTGGQPADRGNLPVGIGALWFALPFDDDYELRFRNA